MAACFMYMKQVVLCIGNKLFYVQRRGCFMYMKHLVSCGETRCAMYMKHAAKCRIATCTLRHCSQHSRQRRKKCQYIKNAFDLHT